MKNTVRILIERSYLEEVTLSKVIMPSGKIFKGLELPWKDNEPNISCIPEGIYIAKKEFSPIVERTSKGKFTQGWRVSNVADRSLITVHIGNTVDDVKGCLLIGMNYSWISNKFAVANSSVAFTQFMKEMEVLSELNQIHFWFKQNQLYS